MANYRTATGKILDMAALAAQNERTRAVGNMKVNARGDTIDSEGRIIVPVTEKVASGYAKTVGQRNAKAKSTLSPIKAEQSSALELTNEEKELLADEELENKQLEEIKAKEAKK